MQKEINVQMIYRRDTKRFHMFEIDGPGIQGRIYFSREYFREGTPHKIILETIRSETDKNP